MKRRLFTLISLCAVFAAFSMLIIPAEAAAQNRSRDRYERDQRDERDQRYERDQRDERYRRDDQRSRSRPSSRYTRRDVNAVIVRVEDGSDRFRKDLDRDLDRSRLDGTKREDRINEDVKRFESELNRLRSEFDSRDDWWESREHVQRAVDSSRNVATRMRNVRFSSNVQAQWRNLLRDINRLAATYELPFVR